MKTALVTGCNGDIGRSICESLKNNGYKVIGLDIDKSNNEHCDDFIYLDLGDPNWSKLPSYKIDVLINNAATQIISNFFEFDDKDIDDIFNINIINVIKLIKRLSFNEGSNIINIGSIHSSQSKNGFSMYATTKGALETLTRSLSIELAPDIRTNMIKPAAINTKMLESGLSKSEYKKLSKLHPVNKIGEVNDISRLLILILENGFINGSIISIDGGISNLLVDPSN